MKYRDIFTKTLKITWSKDFGIEYVIYEKDDSEVVDDLIFTTTFLCCLFLFSLLL